MDKDSELFDREILEHETGRSLFLLHGTGGSKTDFLFLDRVLHNSYTLVGLQGNVSEHGMLRFFRRLGEGVFDRKSIEEESGKFNRFISAWKKLHADSEESTFLGYSNGANMLLATLFLYPAQFQRMVLLHPMMPMEMPSNLQLSGKTIFVSFGSADTMILPEQSKKVIESLMEAGADVRAHEYSGGHQVSQEEVNDVIDFLLLPLVSPGGVVPGKPREVADAAPEYQK